MATSFLTKIPSITAVILVILTFFVLAWIWFYYFEEGKYRYKSWFPKIRILGLLMFIVPFIIGFISYSFLGSLFLPTTIYFDNGYNNSFDIFIDGVKQDSVQGLDLALVEVDKGSYKIEIKQDNELFESLEIDCEGNRKYIYNIGRKYRYFIVRHVYRMSGFAPGDKPELIGDERFFSMPQVDYKLGESAPEKIKVGATTPGATETSIQRG